MKQILTVIFVVLICASMAMSSCAKQNNEYIVASSEIVIEIGADTIKSLFDNSSVKGITILETPDSKIGSLICEGVEVEQYDYLKAESLDWLVYESFVKDRASRISILADLPKPQHSNLTIITGDDSSTAAVTMPADIYAWRQVVANYYSYASAVAASIQGKSHGL